MQSSDERDMKNWRRAVDPASGRVYYYNKLTRETSWNAPSGTEDMFNKGWYSALASKDSVTSAAVGKDIREAKDPRTGRTYFYDRKTRQTYWNDPRLPQKSPAKSVASSRTPAPQPEPEHEVQEEDDEEEDEEMYEEEENYDYGDEDEEDYEDYSTGDYQQSGSYFVDNKIYAAANKFQDLKTDNKKYSPKKNEIVIDAAVKDAAVVNEQISEPESDYEEDFIEDMGGTIKTETFDLSKPDVKIEQQEEPVSLEAVRSSLRLLKKNIVHRAKTPRPSMVQEEESYVELDDISPLQSPSKVKSVWNNDDDENVEVVYTKHRASTPKLNVGGESVNIVCTRRSGCQCRSCSDGIEKLSNEDVPCKFCKRLFNVEALRRHEEQCNKSKYTPNREVLSNRKKLYDTPNTSSVKKTNWRNMSMQLRSAIGSKTVNSGASTNLSHTTDSDEAALMDAGGMVPCPNCHRTFSRKAAERHIPRCKDIVAKPTTLLRGQGKGAYVSKMVDEPVSIAPQDSHQPRSARKSVSPNMYGNPANEANSYAHFRPHSPVSGNRVSVAERGATLKPCPHCGRKFGKKALDRHVEYCSQQAEKAKSDIKAKSPTGRRDAKSKRAQQHNQQDSYYGKLAAEYNGVRSSVDVSAPYVDDSRYYFEHMASQYDNYYSGNHH